MRIRESPMFRLPRAPETLTITYGVVAGMALGVGLGAIRMSSAEGVGKVIFAIGLTIMEIAAVLLLEGVPSGLCTSEAE